MENFGEEDEDFRVPPSPPIWEEKNSLLSFSLRQCQTNLTLIPELQVNGPYRSYYLDCLKSVLRDRFRDISIPLPIMGSWDDIPPGAWSIPSHVKKISNWTYPGLRQDPDYKSCSKRLEIARDILKRDPTDPLSQVIFDHADDEFQELRLRYRQLRTPGTKPPTS